jgi:mannose-6-phosphate isomerase-like protein (cupin superfamily)
VTTGKIPAEALPIVNESESEWLQVTPGEHFKIRTSTRDTDGAYAVLEFVVEPRNGVPMHVHDYEEEHFIIVEGTARMANGDRMLDATPGTSVTVSRGVPHAWYNLSDCRLRMLVTFTPGRIEEALRVISSGKAFDLAAISAEYGGRIVGPPLREDIYTILSPRS